jgi:3-hydroxyisobutyrate dehydrogenase-like beta-hydroxyacid dehydrogenase
MDQHQLVRLEENTMSTIAFIGVGRMGSGMAGVLLDAGHTVHVFDPSDAAVAPVVDRGATRFTSAADAADGADLALLSLPNGAIVRAATLGADSVAAAKNPPRYVLDFSTIDPQTAKAVAGELNQLGIQFLDTPVSGGVGGAASGQLLIMVGGSDEDVAAVDPILSALASRVVHCGPVGAGQLTKLSHNMLTAINTVAAGEILTAAVAAGGDLDTLTDVLGAGLAGSKMLTHFDKTLFTEERPHLFALDLMHKDITLFLDEFKQAVLPLAQLTMQTYNAARKSDLGPKDSSSVVELYEALYDVHLTRTTPGSNA